MPKAFVRSGMLQESKSVSCESASVRVVLQIVRSTGLFKTVERIVDQGRCQRNSRLQKSYQDVGGESGR